MSIPLLSQRIDALVHAVDKARGAAAGGGEVAIEGLERRVEKLCQDITAQPKAEAAMLEPQLRYLKGALDALEAALKPPAPAPRPARAPMPGPA